MKFEWIFPAMDKCHGTTCSNENLFSKIFKFIVITVERKITTKRH